MVFFSHKPSRPEIRDIMLEDEPVRILMVDGAGESAMYLTPGKENMPVFSYAKTIDRMMDRLPEPRYALLIGGAGFSLPRWYFERFPDAAMDVVEKDAGILRAARRYFPIPDTDRLTIHHADGLRFLKRSRNTWDLIINDAYCGFVPEHSLLTNEAVSLIYAHLREGGVYILNLITSLEGEGSMLGVMQQAILKNHFAEVSLTRCKEWKALSERQNCILAAVRKGDK